jgi:hypothetical protein
MLIRDIYVLMPPVRDAAGAFDTAGVYDVFTEYANAPKSGTTGIQTLFGHFVFE